VSDVNTSDWQSPWNPFPSVEMKYCSCHDFRQYFLSYSSSSFMIRHRNRIGLRSEGGEGGSMRDEVDQYNTSRMQCN